MLDVRCSAGTYVRAIARDLGASLGSGAYLAALTRTASGPFRLEDAHPLDHARAELASGRGAALLLPPDAGLDAILGSSCPTPTSTRSLAARSSVSRRRSLPRSGTALVRVVDRGGRLAAMAHVRGRRLLPDKVFVTPGS